VPTTIGGVAIPAQMFAPPVLLVQSWLELTGKLMALQQQALIDILGTASIGRGRHTS
jgi:microcystin-dependent protein